MYSLLHWQDVGGYQNHVPTSVNDSIRKDDHPEALHNESPITIFWFRAETDGNSVAFKTLPNTIVTFSYGESLIHCVSGQERTDRVENAAENHRPPVSDVRDEDEGCRGQADAIGHTEHKIHIGKVPKICALLGMLVIDQVHIIQVGMIFLHQTRPEKTS
jgi:hypothetical protein